MSILNKNTTNNKINNEITEDLERKSNKFLKFIKILTSDISEYIYDRKINTTRKKNKKERNCRVGSRIINNFMEYYKEDCIENFGLLFNAIASISTTNKLNDFVHKDLFIILNENIDKDIWHKIVTYKYQKINKKTNTVKEAYNPIDRCIFKSNIDLGRTLINKVQSCMNYTNNSNETLIDIINIKIENIRKNIFEGDYLKNKEYSTQNNHSLSWYNDNNMQELVNLKDFIVKRINDEKENNFVVKQYIPKRIQIKLLKIHIIKDLLTFKLDNLSICDDLQKYIFEFCHDFELINKHKIKKDIILEKYGTKNEKYIYSIINNKKNIKNKENKESKMKNSDEEVNKGNKENKENKMKHSDEEVKKKNKENIVNNYYESKGLYFKKIDTYGNCNIFSEIKIKGNQLKKIRNGTHIFILKDKKQIYGSVDNNIVTYL